MTYSELQLNKSNGIVNKQPQTLKQRPKWIVWKPGDDGKKIPRAGPNGPDYPDQKVSPFEPESQLPYSTAAKWVDENPEYGLGYVLTVDDPFILIDIDDCCNPDSGEIHPVAAELVDQTGTWADVSVSGTGVHLLGRGEWGRSWHTADIGDGAKVEIYDSKQFVAMSGKPLADSPDRLTDIQATLDGLAEEYAPDKTSQSTKRPESLNNSPQIDRRLKVMFESKHGEKYRALWEGRYSEAGFSDRSEAEQSLVTVLVFFLGRDETAIRKAMNKACREFPGNRKWAERTGVYRDETVKTALETVTETYSPGRGKRPYDLLPEYSQQTFKQADEYLLTEGYGTTKEIAEFTDREPRQIQRVLSNMTDAGTVKWIRDGRNVYYYYVEAVLPDRLSEK